MKKILVILIIVGLVACSKSKVKIEVDNPGNDKYSLKIDDQWNVIAYPLSTKSIYLPVGKHKVIINSNKEVDIELKKKVDYMFNPSYSAYYIEDVEYATQKYQDSPARKILSEYQEQGKLKTEAMKAEEKKEHQRAKEMQEEYDGALFNDTLVVNEKLYIGRVLKVDKFLIAKRWHYSTTQLLPKRIQMQVESTFMDDLYGSSTFRCKIYREKDFVAKVEKAYEELLRLLENELESQN